MRELVSCVKENGNKVMICHVLRYTPFYLSIKERVASGEIGDIINIQTCEHVSYHHLSTSYVRGNGLTPMFATHLCYLQNAATI